ncbi:MAG: response regulator [Deltaproteobacteria bacterium]|nr:response regulator [Deltaproteobacteria bacterium]
MPKKILIVDDDAHIVDYLVAVFTDNGYETCSANNGAEALEVLKKEKPDLITLDLDMPNEAGPRFYRNMTKIEELKETPVIVVSGLAGPHRAIKKAVAAISKPFDPEQLVAVVRDAIGE